MTRNSGETTGTYIERSHENGSCTPQTDFSSQHKVTQRSYTTSHQTSVSPQSNTLASDKIKVLNSASSHRAFSRTQWHTKKMLLGIYSMPKRVTISGSRVKHSYVASVLTYRRSTTFPAKSFHADMLTIAAYTGQKYLERCWTRLLRTWSIETQTFHGY